MKLIIITFFIVANAYGYCKLGQLEEFYHNGEKVIFKTMPEYERGMIYYNRLDFHQAVMTGNAFKLNKRGQITNDRSDFVQSLPITDYRKSKNFKLIKMGKHIFIGTNFEGGPGFKSQYDEKRYRGLFELNPNSTRLGKKWTVPCMDNDEVFTTINGVPHYICEWYCLNEQKYYAYNESTGNWEEVRDRALCNRWRKEKAADATFFKRVLIKDKNGKRYDSEWVKPEKKCVAN